MRRGPIFVAAVAVACLPAVTGLVGNQSFSHSVPVRVPSQARVGPPEVIDAIVRPPLPTQPTREPPPASSAPEAVQSLGAGHESKDDPPHGGGVGSTSGGGPGTEVEPQQSPDLQRGRPLTAEPGDDHGSSSPSSSPAPRPSVDRDSGKGPDGGKSSGGASRKPGRDGASDDRRGHH